MIDLLRTRRTIRKYTQKPLDARTVDTLIEALLRSPSSRSIKPWEFILVDDRELLSKLSKAREHGSLHLRDAALGVVICADSTKSDVWIEDCSIAAILLQMTAHALGLGTCWIQIRNREHSKPITAEQYIQDLLGLPQHIKVECMVSIGYPDETKKPAAISKQDHDKIRHNHHERSSTAKR
ncbi:MAG TPA: nitroreductase family protein [Nitrospirota bacterium]|nr:nitroreductase family protein [Nitrospirota bacterium]